MGGNTCRRTELPSTDGFGYESIRRRLLPPWKVRKQGLHGITTTEQADALDLRRHDDRRNTQAWKFNPGCIAGVNGVYWRLDPAAAAPPSVRKRRERLPVPLPKSFRFDCH